MYKSNIDRIPVEIKTIWVENLRSRKFKQTKGALERTIADTIDDTFGQGNCCLGVLCRVAINDLGYNIKTTEGYGKVQFDNNASYIPKTVSERLGVNSAQHLPVFSLYDESEILTNFYLTGLNDDGFTFKQIADVIDYFL